MKFSIRSLTTAVALGAMATLVQAGDYSSWARYRPVTLNTTSMGLTAAVTNAPIAVRFKAATHKDMLDSASTQVQADGSDIRVTKADGTTDVAFEIEHLSTGPEGRLHIWVLADNVPANSASAGTYRVYWGKASQVSMSNPAATFPTSAGYQAVFHLNDTGATISNSANSGLNGTAVGTTTIVSQSAGNGVVSAKLGARVRAFGNSNGGADDGTANENYIQFSPAANHILSTHTGPLTIEGWVYSSITSSGNTSAGTKTIVAHGDGNTGGKAWFARTAAEDGSSAQNHYSAGGPNSIKGPIAPWGEQHHWQFISAVYNGSNWAIYRNRENDPWNNPTVSGPGGMTPDSVTYKVIPSTTAPMASTMPWFIGGMSDAAGTVFTRGWHGWMDEVRISTVARDSNYVKLTFLTSRADTLASIIPPVSIGATEVTNVGSAYSPAWSGHRTITLNTSASGANVANNVTNFPVLIRLGSAEGDIIAAANGGNSIRFSKADDQTALPYQIESWSSTAAAIWVKVDTVKGNNASQTIRMHWGNASAPAQSNGTAVFDTANGYRAVYHMAGTSTSELDATVNGLTMSASDTVPGAVPAAMTGMVGGARNFAGDTTSIAGRQYFVAANTAANPAVDASTNEPHTISAWVYARTISAANGHGNSVFNKGDQQYAMQIYGNTGATAKLWESAIYTSSWRQAKSKGVAVAGVWYHITGTWSGGANTTNGTGKLYVNGVLDTTIALAIGTANPTRTYNLFIGANPSAGGANVAAPGTARGLSAQTTNLARARYWDGYLDEISFSRTVRSDDFVKLSFQNQKEVNTLTNIGLPVYTVPGQPTAVIATPDTTKLRISWTAPASNGGKAITGYKATVVGDTTLACETATLTCSILNLAPGTSYNIVVRAINEVGGGANSSASNAAIPLNAIVPTAPLTPSAVTNSSSAVTVTWTASAYNGGATITSYTVTSNPGGLTCATAGELTCQVTGLTQGTVYGFTVTASNSAGTSPSSTSTSATTTALLPGAFVIQMDGARHPFTYRLPASVVATTEKLTMSITDVQGKKIWSRTINPAASKTSELTWNGVTSKGLAVAPGLYVVKITALMDGKVIESIQKAVKQ